MCVHCTMVSVRPRKDLHNVHTRTVKVTLRRLTLEQLSMFMHAYV